MEKFERISQMKITANKLPSRSKYPQLKIHISEYYCVSVHIVADCTEVRWEF